MLEGLAPLAPTAAALAVLVSGCAQGQRAPSTLVDGSPVRHASIEFDGVDGPVFVAKTRRTELRDLAERPRVSSCLREGWSEPPAEPIVHRIATVGESVTFSDRSRHTVRACDDSGGGSNPSRAWCGHSFGRLSVGRLRDPRLDLGGCRASDGRPVAFVWIEPGPGTRYVVVHRRGFSEAYETAADLPVRVSATEEVDLARSSAVLELSEHSADGLRLRAYELEAHVSG